MVGVIDYGLGNLYSIAGALKKLGFAYKVSRKVDELRQADHLILPGVGAFADGMTKIRSLGLDKFIQQQVKENKTPILGICLGFQLLFSKGYEFESTPGLSLIEGDIPKLDKEQLKLRVPHVGWNQIEHKKSSLFSGIDPQDCFYFVHSYQARPCDDSLVTSRCHYGEWFVASVQKENIVGTQFHPEKSQRAGLRVLENFLRNQFNA